MGYIPNAMDGYSAPEGQDIHARNLSELQTLGCDVEILDLREYFGQSEALAEKIATLRGVWVRGGNTFVLRQAMKLSGFDRIIQTLERDDFVYGGYSAGVCVLAPWLDGLQLVDNPEMFPYPECDQTIWEGL